MRNFRRIQHLGAAIGMVALLISGAFALDDTQTFFEGYLLAFFFWLSLSLGSLSLLMVHHLVSGRWGVVIRRVLEAGCGTVPLMALFFVPLLFGLHDLYHWTHQEAVAVDPVLQHKAPYLNESFFQLRAGTYWVIWIGLAWLLRSASRRQDSPGSESKTHWLQTVSGPGLVLYVVTLTFAATDWAMSLDPHWFSTIYGLVFVVANGLGTFAFSLIVLNALRDQPAMTPLLKVDRLHDLGKLLFASVMLWAYLNVSQFLIIWMGNLPEEVGWYVHRTHGGWEKLAILLIVIHFLIPFLFLMTRHTKRKISTLVGISGWLLVAHWVDLLWWLRPSEHHTTFTLHWLDISLTLGLGGIWVAVFAWLLERRPLVVSGDPLLNLHSLNDGAGEHAH